MKEIGVGFFQVGQIILRLAGQKYETTNYAFKIIIFSCERYWDGSNCGKVYNSF
jgi:hypothetical protein